MKTAVTIFAVVIVAMLGIVVWDALRTDTQGQCQADCRAKSSTFGTAGGFRQCLNQCQ